MELKILSLVFFISIFSCRSDKQIIEYYDTGQLKSTYLISKRTGLKNSIEKKYSKKGVLLEVTDFREGKKSGIHEEYYPSGNIKIQSKFSSDSLIDTLFIYNEYGSIRETQIRTNNSKGIKVQEYHDNGNLAFETIVYDTIPKGDEYEYHKNGIMQYFKFRDKQGSLIYLREYDDENNFIGARGYPIVGEILPDSNSNCYIINLELASPPHCIREMHIKRIWSDRVTNIGESRVISDNKFKYNLCDYDFKSSIVFHYVLNDTLENLIEDVELEFSSEDFK